MSTISDKYKNFIGAKQSFANAFDSKCLKKSPAI